MTAYYNEVDKYCADWLRNLIREGLIADGVVDDRDIRDVAPGDLDGFDQAHWFAGLGGWSRALRLAGVSDDTPCWTGSCPCQPYSAAGRGRGAADERHLWPSWFWLISQCRPPVIIGEQVASKAALEWLDLVSADLEGAGYAIGAADICAAGVQAPHIRQRLWFVADASGDERGQGRRREALEGRAESWWPEIEPSGRGDGDRFMGHPHPTRLSQRPLADDGRGTVRVEGSAAGEAGAECVADDTEPGRSAQPQRPDRADGWSPQEPGRLRDAGFWSPADWLYCRDGKYRPVEPGSFPLAHGIPARVGKLRAYGNAIVPQVAAEFISAYLESGLT